MSGAELKELLDDRAQVMPLTVNQYHRMIESGIITEGEPYELLNGCVVRKDRSATGEDPMTVGNQHAWAVKNLAKLSRKLESHGCHMQTQQPISLPPRDEPEPDGAIIAGTEDDFRDAHPGAADVLSVIEVADASLDRDRRTKLRTYAGAGIQQYVIINLVARVCEVYTEPLAEQGRYGRSETLAPGKSVSFRTATSGKPLTVPVKRLLP